MKDTRWQEIERLYNSAMQCKPEERAAYLLEVCDEESLRKEVESLLACQSEAKGFIESPALEAAARDFAQSQSNRASAALAGRTLSHYRITEKLGEGGMGVVYKAHDTRLNRPVALKILPTDKVADAERKRRFVQEARSASALNHPNIIHIYDIDSADGADFIAMEYVPGKTLDQLIGRKSLLIGEVLKYAVQIADALAAAHAAGIVHRDLKPANIMVTESALVKLLDFGLAKLIQPAPDSESGTTQTLQPVTQEGTIIGTVSYMSPEQAEGKKVDSRSDIFSFGSVLYEMMTGRRAFQGDSKIAILSAILHQEPKPIEGVPPEMEEIIGRCLRKRPDRRFQHMDDVRVALAELKDESGSGELAPPAVRSRGALVAGLGLGAVLVAALAWFLVTRPNEGPLLKNATFTQLTEESGPELWPSLSPDGKSFVYASRASGNWDIYLQRVGGKNPINLTKDSPAEDTQPAFSPDGGRIAFRSERDGGGIFVMGATGESVKRLTDFGYNPAWSPNGKEIVCATLTVVRPDYRISLGSRLFSIEVSTGEKRLISGKTQDAVQPHWSPHGRRIAYWGRIGTSGDIWTVPAGRPTGEQPADPIPVTSDAAVDWCPVWSPDGKHLYFSSNRGGSMNIWRVAIDEASGRLLGQPEPVTTPSPYSSHISVSADGRYIAYVQQVSTTNILKTGFDPSKETVTAQPVPVTTGTRDAWTPDVSPDGAWLAFGSTGNREDIFVVRTDGTGLRQITDDDYRDRAPVWSPDSKRIAFISNRSDPSGHFEVWAINSDGSGLQQLTYTSGKVSSVPVWSPESDRLGYPFDNYDAFIMETSKSWKDQSPARLPPMSEPHSRFMIRAWSPDGTRLAGERRLDDGTPSGIVTYSFASGKFERLTDFGWYPCWLSDGYRLLFQYQGKIHLVDSRSRNHHEVLSVAPQEVAPYRFALSRDNRWIYFGMTVTEADIWLMNLEGERK